MDSEVNRWSIILVLVTWSNGPDICLQLALRHSPPEESLLQSARLVTQQ